MGEKPNHSRYATNWGVRFLCDCKKCDKEISIYRGIAQEISTLGVTLLSDHQICQQKKVAMQLMIPSLLNGAHQKIIKIIGNSIATIMKEEKFLTEIQFMYFEENGQKELEKSLYQRFGSSLSVSSAQRA